MTAPAPERLIRLLYTSRCAIEAEPEERAARVKDIAEQSAQRNREAGLTGGLVFVDDTFIQIIEGPEAKLETTFERICCDFRHRDLKLIDLSPVDERLFPQWGMAFLTDGGEKAFPLRSHIEEVRFLVGVNAREAERQMRALMQEGIGEPV